MYITENTGITALVRDIASGYESLTLGDLDKVRLLDRVDTKFVFHLSMLPVLLERMKAGYRILETSCSRIHPYQTVYFDTPSLKLYYNHHQGRLNRYKVRFRRYCDADQVYFEIKFKNNKGRTIKKRITQPGFSDIIAGGAKELLTRKTPLEPDSLSPVIDIRYDRITFVNHDFTERITIDKDLTFIKGEESCSLTGLCIAEVKQDRSSSAGFPCLMHKMHVRPLSVSKFCLGIMHLYPEVRKNNFKPKLLRIQKILKNVN
jgi:hypothetical protein